MFHSLPVTVCEGDALWGHLEVDGGGCRQGVSGQGLTDGLGHGLRSRQRLHVHRVDVEDVTGWRSNRGQGESYYDTKSTALRVQQ